MGKIIYWTLENHTPALKPVETNCLFYAANVVRYLKFESTASVRLCLNNKVTYQFGNQRIEMQPGSYFTVNKGAELECFPTPSGTKAVVAYFTTQLLADVNRTLNCDVKTLLDAPEPKTEGLHFYEHLFRQPSRLSNQLQHIAHQMAASDADDPYCPHNLFFSLAENLLASQRQICQQINAINARSTSTKQELFRRVLAARSFMLDQWNTPLALDDVARHACLSPYHFHRTFREAFGEAPMRFFKTRKMEEAYKLLQTSDLKVSELALKIGFADVASFSKAFKQVYGAAPSRI